jgi:hypothetical protein
MRRLPGFLFSAVLAAAPLVPCQSMVLAQDTARTARSDTTRPAADTRPSAPPQPAAASPPFEFSGILFLNYQYGGLKGNRTVNRFEAERAYLTFRAIPGEHFSARITADVYQQRDTTRDQYYRGWAFRAKYAYGQYDFIRGNADALKANVRLGILQTVVIEQEEQFWTRGLSSVAVEQNGFFSSADVGAAATVSFPRKRGELYATITNGNGYTSRETDRFKDYAARLTLTPLASTTGFWKGLAISPWYSKGDRASDFARRRGTVLAVADAQRKDRAGVFVGVRDPRIVLGAHYAQRWDVFETADTARDAAPQGTERTGRVISLHTTVRPLSYIGTAPKWPLAIVFRYDHIKPNVDVDAYARNTIAGLSWEFNRRTSVTFDYQNQAPKDGSAAADSKVYFLHLIAAF